MSIESIDGDAKANIPEHKTLAPSRKCVCQHRHFQGHTTQPTGLPPPMVSGTVLQDGCTQGA